MSTILRKSTAGHSIMESSFDQFKRQASFFLKDKIKTARLKLTDVTPTQLLTEEVTNGNPWPPDARTMGMISRAAFEVDDFWRVVEILRKRLAQFDRTNWRVSYNALILLEHLLTHGPQSLVGKFQDGKEVIEEMKQFHFVDEKGFNWGSRVEILSARVLQLLEDRLFWQEERTRARKLTREIKGFGSLCPKPCSLPDADLPNASQKIYRTWNSHGNAYQDEGDNLLVLNFKAVCRRSNESSVAENKHADVKYSTMTENHPFCYSGNQSTLSLLSNKLE